MINLSRNLTSYLSTLLEETEKIKTNMNNLENLQTPDQFNLVEQSRETLLRLGYKYVAFKSKLKKTVGNLKDRYLV